MKRDSHRGDNGERLYELTQICALWALHQIGASMWASTHITIWYDLLLLSHVWNKWKLDHWMTLKSISHWTVKVSYPYHYPILCMSIIIYEWWSVTKVGVCETYPCMIIFYSWSSYLDRYPFIVHSLHWTSEFPAGLFDISNCRGYFTKVTVGRPKLPRVGTFVKYILVWSSSTLEVHTLTDILL